jgi:hypothetical protein
MSQTGGRLISTVIAAACGVAVLRVGRSHLDVAAVVSAAAFLVALLLDVSLLRSRPERGWYDGRALAESAKTLAWKWSVCGNPYPRGGRRADPALLLADDLRELRASAGDAALLPVAGTVTSDAMRRLREAPLAGRREAYLAGRIDDQMSWYAAKARRSEQAARRWRTLLLLLEGAGGLAGVLKATGALDIPLDAVLASVIGAVGAWLEAQQHDQVARAYAVAVADLVDARARLEAATDEKSWAVAVNDTEDAISREHTRWRASRSQP